MIKTSTKQHAEKIEQPEETPGPQPDELFYDNIKQELNQLVREPGPEVIERILSYSRKK